MSSKTLVQSLFMFSGCDNPKSSVSPCKIQNSINKIQGMSKSLDQNLNLAKSYNENPRVKPEYKILNYEDDNKKPLKIFDSYSLNKRVQILQSSTIHKKNDFRLLTKSKSTLLGLGHANINPMPELMFSPRISDSVRDKLTILSQLSTASKNVKKVEHSSKVKMKNNCLYYNDDLVVKIKGKYINKLLII